MELMEILQNNKFKVKKNILSEVTHVKPLWIFVSVASKKLLFVRQSADNLLVKV